MVEKHDLIFDWTAEASVEKERAYMNEKFPSRERLHWIGLNDQCGTEEVLCTHILDFALQTVVDTGESSSASSG